MKGFRRLIFCAVVLTVVTALLWNGKLGAPDHGASVYIDLIKWLGCSYLGSDAAEKGSAAWASRPATIVQSFTPKGPSLPEGDA